MASSGPATLETWLLLRPGIWRPSHTGGLPSGGLASPADLATLEAGLLLETWFLLEARLLA